MSAHSRRRHRSDPGRLLGIALVVTLCAGVLASCVATPGRTDLIEAVSSTTSGGWRYDYYRNDAYPCAVSGYQTFVIATKVGSSPTASRPLWVKMHGGGVGWFDTDGTVEPSAGFTTEESAATLEGYLDAGLTAQVRAAPEGFRVLAVSMCDHDLYAGTGAVDPYNPHTQPDGSPITTNGLVATKAAIDFTMAQYPTTKYFLHGTSAGGAGAFNVAWGMQLQDRPPAGVVSDSGVLNAAWEQANVDQQICTKGGRDANGLALIPVRWDPDLQNPANQPDLLIARGGLTVPIAHVWNMGDKNSCGPVDMVCPMRDGTSQTLWAPICRHEPVRDAIEAQGPDSRSIDLKLCVDDPSTPEPCDRHVVTTMKSGVNTNPAYPADYVATLMTWVRARLADT